MRDDRPALFETAGLLRSVRTPEFADMVFHEVRARSVLNEVPGRSGLPFRWTINPYRGCSHACVYCFARGTHEYLDLDSGRDFDTQVVVKVNAPEVLRRELASPKWQREPVAMGTNTDPYQRAEGRYALMPAIITELARAGTPLSILTKGTLLTRDLPLLTSVNADVPVHLSVSLALLDEEVQSRIEPGAPGPRARLKLIERIRAAGLPCDVLIAPVVPGITDDTEQLDALIAALAEVDASGVTVLPLHLRPGAREWFAQWLAARRPDLVDRYRELYRGGSVANARYRHQLDAKVRPLLRRHGFGSRPAGRAHEKANRTGENQPTTPRDEQLSLL